MMEKPEEKPGAPPPPPPSYAPPARTEKETAMPAGAGVLLIITGIIGLIGGALISIPFLAIGAVEGRFQPLLGGTIAICGSLGVIFAIFALIGGIFALKRERWGIALTGGVLGLFTFSFIIGNILALVAIILLAVSRKEFKK